MTETEDDSIEDEDEEGEFGDVERELYTSLIPQPRSKVAVLNAHAAQFGLIEPGGWITEEMRRFAGAVIKRCAWYADSATRIDEPLGAYIERVMLPESLDEARLTMAKYERELEEEFENARGGYLSDDDSEDG